MITIKMNASISDIFEETGEWTPENGYDGTEAYEHLKKCSEASAKADIKFEEDWEFFADFEKRHFNLALTDEEEDFYWDYRRELFGRSEEYYMPEGMEYIPVKDRI